MKKIIFVLLGLFVVVGCGLDKQIGYSENLIITPAAPIGFYIEDETTENDLEGFEENGIVNLRSIVYTKDGTINDHLGLIIMGFEREDDVQEYQEKYGDGWDTEVINGQEVRTQRLAGLKTQLTIRWQKEINLFVITGFTEYEKEIYEIATNMINRSV